MASQKFCRPCMRTAIAANRQRFFSGYHKIRSSSVLILSNNISNPQSSSFQTLKEIHTSSSLFRIDTRDGKYLLFDEFKKFIEGDENLVVDVRSEQEVEVDGKINARNYINIPLQELDEALSMSDDDFERSYNAKKPDKDCKMAFHCKIGMRSTRALAVAEQHGYNNAQHYIGGWVEWFNNSQKYAK